MLVDEFYFHERRGLPLWERIGHPLDTLSVAAPLGHLLFFNFQLSHYVGLALFSSVLITKDEFVHKKVCGATEQWLHALLFVLHPLLFFAAYFLWEQGETEFLIIQLCLILSFLFYQLLRWSYPWK